MKFDHITQPQIGEIDIRPRKQTLRGPGGILVHLDASQIYPENPGEGTPIIIEHPEGDDTASWGCGYEGGNLDDVLPERFGDRERRGVMRWLDSISEQVEAWENHHYALATGGNK
jgi:hypothetical protein